MSFAANSSLQRDHFTAEKVADSSSFLALFLLCFCCSTKFMIIYFIHWLGSWCILLLIGIWYHTPVPPNPVVHLNICDMQRYYERFWWAWNAFLDSMLNGLHRCTFDEIKKAFQKHWLKSMFPSSSSSSSSSPWLPSQRWPENGLRAILGCKRLNPK